MLSLVYKLGRSKCQIFITTYDRFEPNILHILTDAQRQDDICLNLKKIVEKFEPRNENYRHIHSWLPTKDKTVKKIT